MSMIDLKSTKCRFCYKCVRSCPVEAIQIHNGKAEIMEDHCILCGTCLKVCPQDAKTLSSELGAVKERIRAGKRVVAVVPTTFLWSMEGDSIGKLKAALLRLGFEDVRETGPGASVMTSEYIRLLREGKMENILTVNCPAAIRMIELYYPKAVRYLAPIVSSATCNGLLVKKELGEDVEVVFLGTCIARRDEAKDPRNRGGVSWILSFKEVGNWLAEEGIRVEDCEPLPVDGFEANVNRLYPITGGVLDAVRVTEGADQDSYHRFSVSGAKDCKELFECLEKGTLKHCFIDVNMCEGGCLKGPAMDTDSIYELQVRVDLKEKVPEKPADGEMVRKAREGLVLDRSYEDRSIHEPEPSEEEIEAILRQTGRLSPQAQLNCGACGFPTCRARAVAVYRHKAEPDMCIPAMHARAESLANLVMDNNPIAVILVNGKLRIMEYSAVGEKYFGVSRAKALGMPLSQIIDTEDCEEVLSTHMDIRGKKVDYPQYGISTLQNIVYVPRGNSVLLSIMDITEQERQAAEDQAKRIETARLAQQVINRQMMVVQQIASLLGETTAETKLTLMSICRTMLGEDYRSVTGFQTPVKENEEPEFINMKYGRPDGR